ncbi:MAG TPA: RsiV family protein [Vicinamibacterales bacterium]|nr:RsiV family protein [Vicinamibacterales bacterium]
MYKARLTSSGISPEMASGAGGDDSKDEWRVVPLTESRAQLPSYEVEIEIPAFTAPDLDELNRMEYGWALTCLQSFRRTLIAPIQGALPESGSDPHHPAGYLSGTFAVMRCVETSLSLRYAMNEYRFGAMHGQTWFRTVTALRKPLVVLHFEDLFEAGSDFVQRVSSFAVDALLTSSESFDPDWVRRGAGPHLGNFTDFNISDDGLLITFPPYQVASYADGPQHVTVPWSLTRDVLNPAVRVLE